MDKQKRETILEKINGFFSSQDIDAEVVIKDQVSTEKFETVLLADGETEITIEPAIEAGAAAVVTTAEGEPIPAPVGEHQIQDGRVIVITEEGVVAEVREAMGDEEEEMNDEVPEKANEVKRIIERIEKEKIFEKVAELEEKFAQKEEEVKFLKEENETLVASFNDLKTFAKETFEALLEEPSKEPVTKQKNIGFKKDKESNMFFNFKKKENE
jgi:microsomal dipeptidase-like Zn-dependent dipeptidase